MRCLKNLNGFIEVVFHYLNFQKSSTSPHEIIKKTKQAWAGLVLRVGPGQRRENKKNKKNKQKTRKNKQNLSFVCFSLCFACFSCFSCFPGPGLVLRVGPGQRRENRKNIKIIRKIKKKTIFLFSFVFFLFVHVFVIFLR